ncbi:MAG: rod shape-determining protein MreD [Tissierellia bacterium]|nr:rod shape-determining protein MreD [Tissierellia bacterium]
MNKIKTVLIILLNIVIQSTILSRFSLFGVHENLSIPIVVALAIGFGAYTGGFSGLVIGLIEDILFSPVIGMRALIYFVLGFLIGSSEAGINKEDIRSGIIFTILGTIFYLIVYYIIGYLIGINISFKEYLFGPIFLEMLYNSIIYIFVFKIFNRVYDFPRFRL